MEKKIRLQKVAEEDFDAFFDEIEKNFIPEERRERADARRLMAEGEYTVLCLIGGDRRVGYITVWELDGFAYVEHFVTRAEYRNHGYGGAALSALKERYDRIVLEAEPPTGEMPIRRLAFYERNGFCRNEQYYFQPAYREGGDGVELVLMSYPTLLSDFHTVARDIYAKVYGREYGEDKA